MHSSDHKGHWKLNKNYDKENMTKQKRKSINWNPWSWNRHCWHISFLLRTTGHHLENGFLEETKTKKPKKTEHQRMLFSNHKQKTNSGWNGRGAGLMQRTDGYTKVSGSPKKRTGREHGYTQRTPAQGQHTHHNTTKYNCQNPRPNQRQGGRAAQDKTPLLALVEPPFIILQKQKK